MSKLEWKWTKLPNDTLEDFRDKEVEKLWYKGKRITRLPSHLESNRLLAILQILNGIRHLSELKWLLSPKSRIRQIKWGKRKGQWKFNLDSQFRIIFTWKEDVRKIYHLEVGEFHDEKIKLLWITPNIINQTAKEKYPLFIPE